tara:strand:- start:397 stop:639 length:243 start_codon:yes stop_codon:yes gene_type:complete
MTTVSDFQKALRLGTVFTHPDLKGDVLRGVPAKKPFGLVVCSGSEILIGDVEFDFKQFFMVGWTCEEVEEYLSEFTIVGK